MINGLTDGLTNGSPSGSPSGSQTASQSASPGGSTKGCAGGATAGSANASAPRASNEASAALTTRTAVAADAEAVCKILREAILETCVDDHRHDPAILDAWLGNKQPAQVRAWMAAPANHMVVAEHAAADGARIVGVALINQAGKLALCHVLPQAQRQGVGKALLDAAEAQARCWGVTTVRIHGTSNSHGFYARFGYLNAGKDKTCYGVECDLLWKQLDVVAGSATAAKRLCSCGPGLSQ